MDILEGAVILEPSGTCTHCVIWLHGLGADGNDFVPVIPHLGLPPTHGVRFIFPHAPERPITINGGMVMRAWYDIMRIAEDGMNTEHIAESTTGVEALIAQQIQSGIPAEQIYLAGFSQGGTIALHTSLKQKLPIGGTIALSTWLPPNQALSAHYIKPAMKTPVFQSHGRQDMVVPHQLGVMAREFVEECGMAVSWREYDMGHEVCAEQLAELGSWMTTHMAV